jgi:Fe-S-cluster containining protein
VSRQTQCRRCGTCCRKGGPALHLADRHLIERGSLPLKHLYTLREGELVWENVRGGVIPLETEIIKIKEADRGRACRFLNEAENGCAVYGNRPLECQALKCWDTREIEALYQRDRLSRRDLLEKIPDLWDLVKRHETECRLQRVRRLCDGNASDPAALARILAYDREIRRLVKARSGIDPEILDFLFGRPLETLVLGGQRARWLRPLDGWISGGPPGAGISDR